MLSCSTLPRTESQSSWNGFATTEEVFFCCCFFVGFFCGVWWWWWCGGVVVIFHPVQKINIYESRKVMPSREMHSAGRLSDSWPTPEESGRQINKGGPPGCDWVPKKKKQKQLLAVKVYSHTFFCIRTSGRLWFCTLSSLAIIKEFQSFWQTFVSNFESLDNQARECWRYLSECRVRGQFIVSLLHHKCHFRAISSFYFLICFTK